MMVKMKASGVEWIGEIPEGWEVISLKHLLNYPLQYGSNIAGIAYESSLPRFIRITDIDDNNQLIKSDMQSLPEEVAKEYILNKDDILFARSGSVNKTYLYNSSDGLCAFAGYLLRASLNTSKTDPKFIFYFTLSPSFSLWQTLIATNSTIQNINAEKYSSLFLPIPPLSIQHKISAYLDRKCAQIDAILSSIQQSIAKLKEYRQAVISQAVTKGLDPDAKMKESGVEWVGEIPEGWEVTKIKNLYNITLGKMLAPQKKNDDETLEKISLCR